MRTSIELRDASRLYREASIKENNRHFKIRLARHALDLAMLAEKIEREEAKKVEGKEAAC